VSIGTLILLRHGRSTANNAGVLAGRTHGVDLDDAGRSQAADVVARLSGARIARVVSSPMVRCRHTAQPLADARGLPLQVDERIAEVDYGTWTGRRLAELADEPLWRTVQLHPAAAVFPGGEALAAVAVRAVAAAREHAERSGDDGAAVLCSHGDVIKAILADALGLHLDSFQRLVVSPASLSVVRYTPLRTFVERFNDTGTLDGVGAPAGEGEHGSGSAGSDRASEATVGGEPGTPAPGEAPHAPRDVS